MAFVMKKVVRNIKDWSAATWRFAARYGLYFVPAAFSLFMALGIFLFPNAAVILGAAFFLFLAVTLAYIAWKFLVLKTRVDEVMNRIHGQVIIHGMGLDDQLDPDFDLSESKKIVFH